MTRITQGLGFIVAFSLLLGAVACGPKSQESAIDPGPTVNTKPKDPAEKVYEQFRSGAFQYGSIVDTLGEAIAKAVEAKQSASGAAKDALDEVLSILDSAGAALEDFQEAPPAEKEFKDNFAKYDDIRLKAIDAGNDALHLLREAKSVFAAYKSDTKNDLNTTTEGLVDLAESDLKEAITAWGGTPEDSEP